ncbi:glycerate kinase [Mucilaginibacter sp. UR6-11]|uniref:glycerate kinase n=1 Tax=Mucilaginibacter sp. UR6-11 TaxID=1435644 RepID=UPI001E296BA7|nr:glycerate kinase [Mucilaginibacter sp. UR6-11]MCC8424675.1 glycerate kinase [Mucilaginibacter sp. UR6-11]
MNILIAPNAFKNSLDAQGVAAAIASGLKQSKLDCNCRLFPVGDGGDGTGDLLIKHLGGELINVAVHDAYGHQITAAFGLVDNGQTAVIEMAAASGLRLLDAGDLHPMLATSTGTGELIEAALDKGVNKIIIGMGGSATVDGGAGILNALGINFLAGDGAILKPVPEALINLKQIDTTGLDKRILDCEIIVLCDVDSTLLGDRGAAAVFGPQKGATGAEVVQLDRMLTNFAAIALQQTGKDMTTIKHSGTAGGAAAGLFAFINAKLVSGADSFLNLTGFDAALQNTDLVITGEGSIDEQTLQGKAPAVVASRAKKRNIKVVGLAGIVPSEPIRALNQYFDILLAINKNTDDLQTALKNTRENLEHTALQLGNSLA